jgi:hypothetical protein
MNKTLVEKSRSMLNSVVGPSVFGEDLIMGKYHSFDAVIVCFGTTKHTSRGSKQRKAIAQRTSEEYSCPPTGRNNIKCQNLLAETKNMWTQEALTDESRSHVESYKKMTYEMGQSCRCFYCRC